MIGKKSHGLFGRLGKTRESLSTGLFGLFKKGTRLDDALFDDIEDEMIMADMGAETASALVESLRTRAKKDNITDAGELLNVLQTSLMALLAPCSTALDTQTPSRPFVLLMVGVNGVGKTTTLAKIAHRLKLEGKTVMLGACDTFRAAAIEQLESWGERLGVPVISQQHGADAAAVAFDAYQAAKARKIDVLLLDSAGRQHTHGDLMDQLKKMFRALRKADPHLPHEVMLTVDAATGQNALSQIDHFQKAVEVNSLSVTKLDGTAKGGVMIAMAQRFGLPIRFIGVGEGMEDLQPFDAETFTRALIPDSLGEG